VTQSLEPELEPEDEDFSEPALFDEPEPESESDDDFSDEDAPPSPAAFLAPFRA
jgi:hypothetical protein